MSVKSLAVIGGGPAGMMAAGMAAGRGIKTYLIERNGITGKKLRITGKGRCNLTAAVGLEELIAHIPGNGEFLREAFTAFSSEDTVKFFEGLGVQTKIERGGRVFPVSDDAHEAADALAGFVKKSKAKILTGRVHTLNSLPGGGFEIQAAGGIRLQTEGVILATGGASYPLTGSTGDGYTLAQKLGHPLTALRPALVPIETKEDWVKSLAGPTLKNVQIRIHGDSENKALYEDFGELAFLAYGVGGPVMLSASVVLKDSHYPCRLWIDLKPGLSESQLQQRILKDLQEKPDLSFSGLVSGLMPSVMAPVFSKLTGIALHKKNKDLTGAEQAKLAQILKNFPLTLNKPRPIEEGIITAGGIAVHEINPKTMESLKVKGLYFAGEILDCHGFTGGYNLQIAFSTGYAAGISC